MFMGLPHDLNSLSDASPWQANQKAALWVAQQQLPKSFRITKV